MSPQELREFLRTRAGDAAASNDQAAFNPSITNPQEAKDKASEGNKINPLDVSPANPDISSATEEVEGGIKKKAKCSVESAVEDHMIQMGGDSVELQISPSLL